MKEGIINTISPNGAMANESIVQVTPVGQYIITIPRALAQARKLKKGDRVEFLETEAGLIIQRKLPPETEPGTK